MNLLGSMSHTSSVSNGFVAAKRHAAHHMCFEDEFYWLHNCNHVYRVSLLLPQDSVGNGRVRNSPCVSSGTRLYTVMRTFHGDTEGDVSARIRLSGRRPLSKDTEAGPAWKAPSLGEPLAVLC